MESIAGSVLLICQARGLYSDGTRRLDVSFGDLSLESRATGRIWVLDRIRAEPGDVPIAKSAVGAAFMTPAGAIVPRIEIPVVRRVTRVRRRFFEKEEG